MDARVICCTSLMFADASTVIRCTSRTSSIEVWITWQDRWCSQVSRRSKIMLTKRTRHNHGRGCLSCFVSIGALLFSQACCCAVFLKQGRSLQIDPRRTIGLGTPPFCGNHRYGSAMHLYLGLVRRGCRDGLYFLHLLLPPRPSHRDFIHGIALGEGKRLHYLNLRPPVRAVHRNQLNLRQKVRRRNTNTLAKRTRQE